MKRFGLHAALAAGLLIVLGVGSYAIAGGNDGKLRADGLTGYAENPDVSTVASGTFQGTLDRAANTITYHLTYTGLEGNVSQSHIHFGKTAVSGGFVLFLCTNLGNGPAGTQACPTPPATVTGVLGPGDIVDVAASQGITGSGNDAAEWEEIERAVRAGRTYVNVHSSKFPGGEIRAQIRNRGNDD